MTTTHPRSRALRPVLWLCGALVLTCLVYLPGLRGPFVLDDLYNLQPIEAWLKGQVSLQALLFNGTSGMFGRPLAMATLALSASLGGFEPFAFKLGNLLVHLLCGGSIFLLVRHLGQLDPRLRGMGDGTAVLVATLWLLHPLQASTVLYSVQRMAQMSTLFVLVGLWLFVSMRSRIQRGPDRNTLIALFAGIPALLAAGFLSKENALLLPALCLVVELGYYRDAERPREIKAFFGLYLLLPLLAGLAWFAIEPARLLGGYLRRDFDLQERLLTQARALCDYLWKVVAPNPPRMGVYTDDFIVSTGLLSPATTLASILVLLAISATAWKLRARLPALFVGWGIFLVGHSIESSVIPLEIYYEHRNYLPLLGVLLALVGMAVAAGDALGNRGVRSGRIGRVLCGALIALLAFGTFARATIWSSPESLALTAVANHPHSVRANMALVDAALDHGNRELVAQSLQRLTEAENPRTRASGYLNRFYLACALDNAGNPDDLMRGVAQMPARMTYAEPELFGLLFERSAAGCGEVDAAMLGVALAGMVDRAVEQPDSDWAKWQLRYLAARFYERAGLWTRTRQQAQLAWQPGAEPAVAGLLVRAYVATGDLAGAERVYAQAATRIDKASPGDVAGLRWLRSHIEAARRAPGSTDAR